MRRRVSANDSAGREFDYQRYLASREWALLKEAVKRRASITGESERAVCERCESAPVQATHHLTYERIGHEELEDLLGVCRPCHKFLSGKSSDDPLGALVVESLAEMGDGIRAAATNWATDTSYWYLARCDVESVAYTARVVLYRIARKRAAQTVLPLTVAAILAAEYLAEVPEPMAPLTEAEVRNFSTMDRLFVRFQRRKEVG